MSNNIQNQIDEAIKELKITSLDISFNEIADMYRDGELIITPIYQRTFRWSLEKQSRFIESLLLEMPIPPIYAIEIDDGKYELIDGLQRISSYLSFRNMLNNQDSEPSETPQLSNDNLLVEEFDNEEESIAQNGFSLTGCDIIKELNGKTYEDLPTLLKIRAKRCFVRMEILRKGINPTMKYHMFKRLNTGGEKLSPQEIRNCSIRIIDNKFINYINALAKDRIFLETLENVSIQTLEKKFAEELVLRFFALKNDFTSFTHNIDSFLTQYMEKVSMMDASGTPCFDYEKERKEFTETFQYINKALGKQAFGVYRTSGSVIGFNVYNYEAITYAVAKALPRLQSGDLTITELANKINQCKQNPDFKKYTVGGGKNSSSLLNRRCNFVLSSLGEPNV